MKIKINLFFKKYNYLLEGLCMKNKIKKISPRRTLY